MKGAVAVLSRLPIRQDIGLVMLIMATLAMMVLPMPTEAADILIAVSIGISVLLLMAAVYLVSPADFSTLPTVILLTTIFRLSISITTSRLVLTQADAGDIIRTFGEFVISGNVVVGLVVFLIISVVQFVVITKGAERVAEVAARFALDALPGKQMSIDNDARNGAIKADEAKRRRQALERESQLFGAMDGAMKFVKGDAIASLLIIAVNLLGGIAIGCVQRGMSLGEAGETYSLLAIGDGLIAQIPALLISLTAGLVVTRVGPDSASNLGADIIRQVGSDSRVLIVAAAILLALGLIPGFPTLVFAVLAAAAGGGGWMVGRHRKRRAEADEAAMKVAISDNARGAASMQVRLGHELISARASIDQALRTLRSEMTEELGITLPRIEVAEANDTDVSGLCLEMNRIPLLSVPMRADETWSDVPVEGVPMRMGPGGREWAVVENKPDADQSNMLDAVAVITLFARQTMLRAAGQLVGIQETQVLISRAEASYGDLVREATRSAPLPRLAEVFRRLVAEGISLRDMRQVLEAVAEWAPRESSPALLSEYVRIALRQQICHAVAGASMTLRVVFIEDEFVAALLSSVRQTISGDVLQPEDGEGIIDHVRRKLRAVNSGRQPLVVVTVMELRRHLREFLLRYGIDVCVMSHQELAPGFHIDVVGTVGIPDHWKRADGSAQKSVKVDGAAAPSQIAGVK
ncbi:type III secretion system export apparatus subunit SctV [Bradyrhizobium sp. Tv2a-2]|uniref:type III secretion system export apparatus subunit SctV n=1 Tax=Bradyrhizobium sp. Tv2a-2 TaxID=113395 RepID=UPI00046697F0|nr:type III secretion system export apparatus subunit SctV [Bradyrhizobium sp. Tv2a-2]